MGISNRNSRQHTRIQAQRQRLAACMAAALGLTGLHANASTLVVNTCKDAFDPLNPNRSQLWLRAAVADAQSGDVIDLSQLTCSTITLINGAIPVPLANLSINGPTGHSLTIDGNHQDRVFNQTSASGQLLLSYLTVANGTTSGNGGCIQSVGTVHLFSNVTITGCSASGKGGGIAAPYVQANHSTISSNSGGGIYASGTRSGYGNEDLLLQNTTVSGNTGGGGVIANRAGGYLKVVTSMINNNVNNTSGACGGIDTGQGIGFVSLKYSSVIENQAANGIGGICAGSLNLFHATVSGNTGHVAGGTFTDGDGTSYDFFAQYSTIANNIGGGVHAYAAAFYDSTISGNRSNYTGGVSANHTKFVNSTISGNTGTIAGGVHGFFAKLYNSTVAFNTNPNEGYFAMGIPRSGGISVGYYCPSTYGCSPRTIGVSVNSSIVANNIGDTSVNSTESDVAVLNYGTSRGTLTGSNSLIMSSNVQNSAINSDPQLLPLANNGGPVQTHALGPNSPALGVGSNPKNLGFDERGAGFLRTWVNGQTDIGAFQTQDRIFANGFQ